MRWSGSLVENIWRHLAAMTGTWVLIGSLSSLCWLVEVVGEGGSEGRRPDESVVDICRADRQTR
eukprot:scaffold298641_cov41-Prasinocladus_malaysianus.AAC.2